jgi:isochorismate synthase
VCDCEGDGVVLLRGVKQVDVIEPKGGYRVAVAQAIEAIKGNGVEKVVLARGVILEAKEAWEPWAVARALKQAYPYCQLLVWITPEGDSYIAASPERLLSVNGTQVWTEALAGTAARGDTPEADAVLGAALLESAKDGREQALVCAQIVRRLEAAGLEVTVGERTLRKLPLLQHVLTPIWAEGNARILSIVHKLHPTSAICGEPKKQAAALIKDLEGFQRGWYAGAFGWANAAGEGHFVVGIRGVELQGCFARIICGAGIIEASDPQKEEAETSLKMQGIVRSLQNTFLLNSCSVVTPQVP